MDAHVNYVNLFQYDERDQHQHQCRAEEKEMNCFQ